MPELWPVGTMLHITSYSAATVQPPTSDIIENTDFIVQNNNDTLLSANIQIPRMGPAHYTSNIHQVQDE